MPPAKPPARRVTLRDVAARLGVSPATVSNAYNRPDQLSPELRDRVLGAARDLGYSGPDPLARSLRRGRTGVIGVVYDAPLDYAFADPAAALFLGSVAQTLQGAGLNLLLLSCVQDTAPVRTASVDGLIVSCSAEGSELLRAVLARQLPTVLVEQNAQPGTASVTLDDLTGAREAAAHLHALGHREIGVLTLEVGPGRAGGPFTLEAAGQIAYRTTARRLQGYRAGAPGATLHLTATGLNTPQEGEARALELLRAQPQLTALLCMSDVLAQGALRAAHRLGLRVPQDLSLIGFDDLPSSAALDLSSVWQPTAEKGERVGLALRALLDGQRPPDVDLPTRLVVRGSAAAPRLD
ncbi:Transcriptional regulator, sugar-binding [Deinococcus phoenicis]|uniref:Transcriptional regulator, sugar-binding n=1 Tax=Deinococcus phoenicis TaxID=1476583 RepID=A0A016QNY7_9DEIO|nr:LacI family DNA-binding transcriptional regulator [Deinococcus phoenicis]EYB67557.1 Transcriptional regulator, sugar-binding [Deinococcus phoenicis]